LKQNLYAHLEKIEIEIKEKIKELTILMNNQKEYEKNANELKNKFKPLKLDIEYNNKDTLNDEEHICEYRIIK
jgi:hypothetical protein